MFFFFFQIIAVMYERIIVSIASKHDNLKEDRIWKFQAAESPWGIVSLSQFNWVTANSYQGDINFECDNKNNFLIAWTMESWSNTYKNIPNLLCLFYFNYNLFSC